MSDTEQLQGSPLEGVAVTSPRPPENTKPITRPMHPLSIADLLQKATDELAAQMAKDGRGANAIITDVKVTQAGWHAYATVKVGRVLGGELSAGGGIRQDWGGNVDAEGRAKWERRW